MTFRKSKTFRQLAPHVLPDNTYGINVGLIRAINDMGPTYGTHMFVPTIHIGSMWV